MTHDDAKSLIKNELEKYLISNGVETRKNFKCLNPDHKDEHPSMSFDKKRNKVHCFTCKVDYDIFDLIQMDYNLANMKEAFDKGFEMYNVFPDGFKSKSANESRDKNKQGGNMKSNFLLQATPAESMNEKYKQFLANRNIAADIEKYHKQVGNTDYFKSRGFGDETIIKYKLGYAEKIPFVNASGKDFYYKNCVIIPYPDDEYYAIRMIEPSKEYGKYSKLSELKDRIFNLKALYENDDIPLFVVEGQLDAISIYEAGGEAISLNGTANVHLLLSELQEKATKRTLILSLDNDSAGFEAMNELENGCNGYIGLQELNIEYLKYNICGDCKDANEALLKNKESFFLEISEAIYIANERGSLKQEIERSQIDEYIKQNSVNSYFHDFVNEIKSSEKKTGIATGFTHLDECLGGKNGGLYPGLYVIGAISSLGKTTFALNICDYIAEHRRDVLIFSLEMPKKELTARSLSRISHQHFESADFKGFTTRDILNCGLKNDKHIDLVVKKYGDIIDNLFITEGNGDIGVNAIRQTIERHIQSTNKIPVVLIDYLQIIKSQDFHMSDKQNVDNIVSDLKRISRQYNIPIIAISSFNRACYKDMDVGFAALKESGSIEFSADVVMVLQFHKSIYKGSDAIKTENANGKQAVDVEATINKAKSAEVRKLECNILKNRNGATGDSVMFDYKAKYNYFEESEDGNSDKVVKRI